MPDATPLPDALVKMCSRCRETKSRDEFHKCTARKDGLNAWCKPCHRKHRTAKPSGTCGVEGCARATSGGAPKCDTCYAGGPPLARGLRTRGMPRHDDHGNRLCSDCLSYLPVSRFTVHGHSPDGISRICRTCHSGKQASRKYGLTLEQAQNMWASPCAICGYFEAGQMVIDHCHGGGEVRGTLCNSCNVSIGHFLDDPDLLERAAGYLRRFGRGSSRQDDRSPSTEIAVKPQWSLRRTRFRTSKGGRKPGRRQTFPASPGQSGSS